MSLVRFGSKMRFSVDIIHCVPKKVALLNMSKFLQ